MPSEKGAPNTPASVALADQVRAVFKEDELAAWSQDSSDTSNSLSQAGNRRQHKGTNNRIDPTFPQRNALSWQIQKLDIQFSSAPLLFGDPNHPEVGFEIGFGFPSVVTRWG